MIAGGKALAVLFGLPTGCVLFSHAFVKFGTIDDPAATSQCPALAQSAASGARGYPHRRRGPSNAGHPSFARFASGDGNGQAGTAGQW
eukprot:scaffold374_cov271-Pinguiococcus_pyrenoidosus.AAC.19